MKSSLCRFLSRSRARRTLKRSSLAGLSRSLGFVFPASASSSRSSMLEEIKILIIQNQTFIFPLCNSPLSRPSKPHPAWPFRAIIGLAWESDIIIVVSMNRRITEENEDSISLHDNTVFIQDYNNLDYSDEYDSAPSSQEHSLSGQHRAELMRAQEVSKTSKMVYFDSYLHQHHASRRPPFPKPHRDLESKYDFAASPSTKEEYSLLNPPPRLSHSRELFRHSRHRNHLDMPSLDEHPQEQSECSSQKQQKKPQKEVQARGQAERQSAHFDIDSFLNAHPVPLKNKKGLSVLAQSNRPRQPERSKLPSKGEIKVEDSIVLVTLTENESSYSHSYSHSKAIKKSEQQQRWQSDAYPGRLQQIRLRFINNFTLAPLKPLASPYNFLQYVKRKQHLL